MGAPDPSPPPSVRSSAGERALLAWNLAVYAGWLAGPFLAAGTLRWPAGLAHLGALLVGLLGHRRYVRRHAPALRERRRRIGAGTPAWDLWWNALLWPLFASIAVAAGLERGGAALPLVVWPAGAALLALGFSLSARAMVANPFFEGTVRLQADRGQRVIDAGPYARVRHPGYLGLCCWALATPLLLLSVRAIGPAIATALWIVLRTAGEDALLRRGLPGYSEYSSRVRWRLVPGVW